MIGERFRVERRLGRGGMASVHLALDEELHRPVAVKVLDALAGDEEARRRFVREARLAARLSHPNVVAVYDVGGGDGAPYIVMEYVEGETLADLFARRGRLEPEEAVGIAVQACAGLAHAHAAGLVHRDVKPQNLLVRKDGTVKISDFGIARAAEATRLTMEGTILGTAGYLAPEQLAGQDVSTATDVYGVGAVLYEALTGRPPVVARSLEELAAAHARAVPPVSDLAPGVPRRLEEEVMRALARRPEYRHRSAAELAHRLAAAVPEADTVPLPAEAPTARLPVNRRGRGRLAGLAAVVALAALAAGIMVASGDEAPPEVEPVPQSGDPQQHARDLAAWLRENSR